MIASIKRHALLVSFFLFFFTITILAYVKLFPTEIKGIPYYDSVGHFLLFGLYGLIAHYSFQRKQALVFGRMMPLGPTLVIAYAFIDESLQSLSVNRTFDLLDLFWGVFGVLVFVFTARIVRNWKLIDKRFVTKEFFSFGIKEAHSALFAGTFLFLLFASSYISFGSVYRYDFLFIAAIAIQILLIACGLETKDEAKTIFLFHIIGLILEIYKTNPAIGSWTYPEPGYLKIFGVPLYSGFMYASIGSYIAYAWKAFRLRLTNHPSYRISLIICFFIYLNFFTNHFIPDLRILLFAAILIIYYRTDVYFTPRSREYKMPLIVGFLLIACFVWIAENIGTFYGAWKYPSQIHAWEAVSLQKITSWFLLVIICFIIVAYLKHFKQRRVEA